MTPAGILFTLVCAITLLLLPRRFAPLPLLLGTCYMPLGEALIVGPFHFTVIRCLLGFGMTRLLLRGERPAGGLNRIDYLLIAWGGWALVSSAFHKLPGDYLVGQSGIVYNTLGIYFLIRSFCQSLEDLVLLVRITAVLLAPVALEMLNEVLTGHNLFSFLGGVLDLVTVRDDKFRAQGPFAHGILAGTVGAVCFPLMAGIWRSHPREARIGAAACVLMVATSNSSGPLMSFVFAIFALVLWRWRHLTRQMRIAAVVGYIVLDMIMKAPAYFLIARIDLTGSSTGWHRAELIQSSIRHLNEWWFAGTDYTRDWMPTGVTWSPDHTDITNHYLSYGVSGGLLMMGLFMAAMAVAFRYFGNAVAVLEEQGRFGAWFAWALGAALFTHAATCISVAYFDQSFVFLYLVIAAAGCVNAHVADYEGLERNANEEVEEAPITMSRSYH